MNAMGAKLGYVVFDTTDTAKLIQGVRVNYADDAAKGYEIEPLTSGSFNAKETGKYVKYNDGNGDKWSTKGGDVLVTSHDWKVYKGLDAKVTVDGNTYYGTAGTTNVAAATGAVVKPADLKAGDNIKVDKSGTITFITKTAAATTAIADGDIYDSGYVKITKDTANIDKVEATGVVTPSAEIGRASCRERV